MDLALWLTGLTVGAFHSMAIEEGIAGNAVSQRCKEFRSQHQLITVESIIERLEKKEIYERLGGGRCSRPALTRLRSIS